jgi:hypothetical protein
MSNTIDAVLTVGKQELPAGYRLKTRRRTRRQTKHVQVISWQWMFRNITWR